MTAEKLVTDCLNTIKNETYKSCIEILSEKALNQARESDRRLKNGTARKLEGLPIVIKINFHYDGTVTTAGHPSFKDWKP